MIFLEIRDFQLEPFGLRIYIGRMAQNYDPRRRKTVTLAALEELYFNEGFDSAKAAFESLAEPRSDWAIVKPGHGTPAQRTGLAEGSGINYDDFSAPALWQPPYGVMLASLEPKPRTDYVSHSGEEIAIPIEGKIRFHFFWSKGREDPGEFRPKDVGRGAVLRLNPDVPHHAWAVGKPAKTWLIFRHASETETAVSTDRNFGNRPAPLHNPGDRLSEDKLHKPGRYALLAWGLAGKLKSYRERAELSIKKVAERCGIDHTHLSRIESGGTNISVAALLRVAKFLRVDIGEFFTTEPWCNQSDSIPWLLRPSQSFADIKFAPRTGCRHLLHATAFTLPTQERKEIKVEHSNPHGPISSCIVLEGRLIANLNGVEELLSTGAVMHLRGNQSANVQALESSVLFKITHSNICCCQD